jgi:hypothetical protein
MHSGSKKAVSEQVAASNLHIIAAHLVVGYANSRTPYAPWLH